MKFTKKMLSLEEGLKREWIITNGIGGFCSSTILGANTRKYHGLLIAPLNPPARRFLVLSKVDESIEIEGKEISSIDFSNKLNEIRSINSNITFIIGGSYGLSDEIKNRSNYKLSFSKMTFPHQLFRVLLLEQIYRAFKIINNESYHK